ncbi:MAG: universal stress protein [Desulfobacterales bacterium]
MIPEIRRILYATDLSDNSRHAFGYAVAIAERFGASITLFHVVEDFSPASTARIVDYIGEEGWAAIQKRRSTEFLDTIKGRMADFCNEMQDSAPECELRVDEMTTSHGHAAEEILRQVDTGRFDVVVMGTHGIGGMTEALMGSTARRVVRRSVVPVLTVRLPGRKS